MKMFNCTQKRRIIVSSDGRPKRRFANRRDQSECDSLSLRRVQVSVMDDALLVIYDYFLE